VRASVARSTGRRFRGAAAALALAPPLVATARARAFEPRGCVTFYVCRTIHASSRVRVYQVTPRPPREPVEYAKTYALWRPSHRITPLGDRYSEGFLEPGLVKITLDGEFVAYALTGTGVFREEISEGLGWQLWRLNARTGHAEKVARKYKCVAADQSEHWDAPGVSDLITTRRGELIWIFGSYYVFPANYRVCELRPKTTSPILLASSQAIAPRSLTLVSGRASWLEGGVRRTAPL
jgi:hypothetical protein